jgi:hypothetical protein
MRQIAGFLRHFVPEIGHKGVARYTAKHQRNARQAIHSHKKLCSNRHNLQPIACVFRLAPQQTI